MSGGGSLYDGLLVLDEVAFSPHEWGWFAINLSQLQGLMSFPHMSGGGSYHKDQFVPGLARFPHMSGGGSCFKSLLSP
jgi:hypothetical protein